jgi:phage gp29-like protein
MISSLLQPKNNWRNQYNPLRNLSMQRLVFMLEEGERGAYADLQWLYRMIEKRDAVLRAGRRLRGAALAQMDWTIKTVSQLPNGVSPQLAEAQARELRHAYDNIDNLKEAIEWLATAEFRGFAHLEKHRDENHNTLHLEPVPQWLWVRDGLYGAWEYNAEARSGATVGTPVDRDAFIIREVSDPIDEIAAISFLRRNLSQKDWDGFVETYGIPPLFIEMPPNIPLDRQQDYQSTAEAVLSDARGALPNGAKIQTINTALSGTPPFREHIAYQDQVVVLAITGGKLTMLNDATGIGGSQARVHQDVFNDLAVAEASTISEIFQRQFDAEILDAAFPEMKKSAVPHLAYFEIVPQQKSQISETLDHASKLNDLGFELRAQDLSEKTGYNLVSRKNSNLNPKENQ